MGRLVPAHNNFPHTQNIPLGTMALKTRFCSVLGSFCANFNVYGSKKFLKTRVPYFCTYKAYAGIRRGLKIGAKSCGFLYPRQ